MEKAIICVDDEKFIIESLKSQLIPEFGGKYIIEFAESGEEGLQIFHDLITNEVEIAIIISDWLMPKMKGDEFLIEVHRSRPDIHTVMLSGYADDDSIRRISESAGLYKFMTKPWEQNDLYSVIYEGIN